MSLSSAFRDTLYGLTSCCFPNPTVQINKQTFKVIHLLGEGGFAYVYLILDVPSGHLYALKKIQCPPGDQEAVGEAMREVDMYRMFQHDYIIKVLNTSISMEKDGTRTVYIFLPYYKRGNLQDSINANNLNKTHFPERDLLLFFRKICYAVRVLHRYRLPRVPMRNTEDENQPDMACVEPPMMPMSTTYYNANGYRYHDQEEEGTLVPYAHRDLKPSNILIADDGQTPILTDFGSITRARIRIKTKSDAMRQQDLAAEHTTMAYRAPELYDVQPGMELDEKIDIWSLGCLLYATAYGSNPYEATMQQMGGSLTLAIHNNDYKFPAENDPYSDDLRRLIRSMLVSDPKERADIQTIIDTLDCLLDTPPSSGSAASAAATTAAALITINTLAPNTSST